MVFSSISFVCVFLPVVLLAHQMLPSMRTKNALLIMASLLFYAYGEPVFVILMLVSTIANWLFGLGMQPHFSPLCRRIMLVAAVVVNLAFLAVFKYAGMLVETVNDLFGLGWVVPSIALPIGISFYTFQALSYVIDAYRGTVEVQRSYTRVLLYISFFPQLIAGPIVKYRDVSVQLANRRATLDDIALGLRRFCFGLGKKVLIANTMAQVADAVFSAPVSSVNIAVAWIGAAAYFMQIYFDFSGYSDMAIGMARAFGFQYKENFNYPYAATTIKEFWRRWHISLSTWFKEYLYIPLGGNRHGRLRTVGNKLVVFFFCGLWHGANWTFVTWGLIHGFFLLLEEYLPVHRLPKVLGWVYALLVACTAFVIFRAETLSQGLFMVAQMFSGFHFETACTSLALQQFSPVTCLVFVFACIFALPVKPALVQAVAHIRRPTATLTVAASFCAALGVLGLSMLALSSGGYNPFIYFRF